LELVFPALDEGPAQADETEARRSGGGAGPGAGEPIAGCGSLETVAFRSRLGRAGSDGRRLVVATLVEGWRLQAQCERWPAWLDRGVKELNRWVGGWVGGGL
jgi:hypothetical protein